MGVVLVGISHKTAPVELRERLAVPGGRLGAALNELMGLRHVREAVVLSTCNRLEVYARPTSTRDAAVSDLRKFFLRLYDHPNLPGSLYERRSLEAVRHLFRVAAGLDSMVLGETDILGQVKSAYRAAKENRTTGKITNVLFQRALFVGKQVRSATTISEGGTSVGNVAVQLAERIFGPLRDHRVVVVGAGDMAETMVRHLLSQKAGRLVVLNRTREKADDLARLMNGEGGPLDRLPDELGRADVVICSAATDRPIVTPAMVERAMAARRGRSLYLIDIAVPRNVDGKVNDLDNVYLYDIDDFQAVVDETLGRRRAAMDSADGLVERMADDFATWMRDVLRGERAALRHSIFRATRVPDL